MASSGHTSYKLPMVKPSLFFSWMLDEWAIFFLVVKNSNGCTQSPRVIFFVHNLAVALALLPRIMNWPPGRIRWPLTPAMAHNLLVNVVENQLVMHPWGGIAVVPGALTDTGHSGWPPPTHLFSPSLCENINMRNVMYWEMWFVATPHRTHLHFCGGTTKSKYFWMTDLMTHRTWHLVPTPRQAYLYT